MDGKPLCWEDDPNNPHYRIRPYDLPDTSLVRFACDAPPRCRRVERPWTPAELAEFAARDQERKEEAARRARVRDLCNPNLVFFIGKQQQT